MFCVVCWQKKKKANQHVPALVTHLQGQRIVIVACGEAHTLGVTKQGSVWSWGHGERGRLGHGDEVVYACTTHTHTERERERERERDGSWSGGSISMYVQTHEAIKISS